jgi:hypothetical protein
MKIPFLTRGPRRSGASPALPEFKALSQMSGMSGSLSAGGEAHERHQRSIDIVRPLRDMRMAADHDVAGAVSAPLEMDDVRHLA